MAEPNGTNGLEDWGLLTSLDVERVQHILSTSLAFPTCIVQAHPMKS